MSIQDIENKNIANGTVATSIQGDDFIQMWRASDVGVPFRVVPASLLANGGGTTLPINISDVTGLQTALDSKTNYTVTAESKGIAKTNTPAQNATALNAFLANIPVIVENIALHFDRGAYYFGDGGRVTIPAHVKTIEFNGAGTTLYKSAVAPFIEISGKYDTAIKVTALQKNVFSQLPNEPYSSSNQGERTTGTQLVVNTTDILGGAHTINLGDLCKIVSLDCIKQAAIGVSNSGHPEVTGTKYIGEFCEVAHKFTDAIVLNAELTEDYITDVHIAKLHPCSVKFTGNVTLSLDPNVDFSNVTTGGGSEAYVVLKNFTDVSFEWNINKSVGNAVIFASCYNVKIPSSTVVDLPDDPNNPLPQQYGYAYTFTACHFTDATKVNGRMCRHLFTTNAYAEVGRRSANPPLNPVVGLLTIPVAHLTQAPASRFAMGAFGRNMYLSMSHCSGSGGANAFFDGHDEDRKIIISHNFISNSNMRKTPYNLQAKAVQVRGEEVIIINNIFDGVGIWVQTTARRFDRNTFARDVLIANNRITNVAQYAAIELRSAKNITVRDNYISDSEYSWQGNVIEVSGDTDVTLINNRIFANSNTRNPVVDVSGNAKVTAYGNIFDASKIHTKLVDGVIHITNAEKPIFTINNNGVLPPSVINPDNTETPLARVFKEVDHVFDNNTVICGDNVVKSFIEVVDDTYTRVSPNNVKFISNAGNATIYRTRYVNYTSDAASFANNSIIDKKAGFLTSGVVVGDVITIDCASSTANEGVRTVTAVSADALTVDGAAFTAESAAIAGAVNITTASIPASKRTIPKGITLSAQTSGSPFVVTGDTNPDKINLRSFEQVTPEGAKLLDINDAGVNITGNTSLATQITPSSNATIFVYPQIVVVDPNRITALPNGKKRGDVFTIYNDSGAGRNVEIVNGGNISIGSNINLTPNTGLTLRWLENAWTKTV